MMNAPAISLVCTISLLLVASPAVAAPAPVAAEDHELAVGLSEHEVAVTVDYAGARIVLFGATKGAGDVLVEVRGPLRRDIVRRKSRTAGVWLNRGEVVFDRVPTFYAVAGNGSLDEVLPATERERENIGVENLWLLAEGGVSAGEAKEYREALIRIKQRARLYPTQPGHVQFIGNRLFRTDIQFPASASVGSYNVKVFLVKNGRVVSETTTPLILSRVGFEARVFRLAHDNSLAYGLLATAIALVAGWLANVFFRSKA